MNVLQYARKRKQYAEDPCGDGGASQGFQKGNRCGKGGSRTTQTKAKGKVKAEDTSKLSRMIESSSPKVAPSPAPSKPVKPPDYYSVSSQWYDNHVANDLKAKDTLEKYSGKYYRSINAFLRMGSIPTGGDREHLEQEAKAMIKTMDKVLSKASLPQDVEVHRGISNVKSLGIHPDYLDDAKGWTIQDKGFISTTMKQDVTKDFTDEYENPAVIHIKAPKGSRGASMAGISMIPYEQEILFARDTKMKISRAYKDQDGMIHIDAEIQHE